MRHFSEFEKSIIKNLVNVDLMKSNILDFISNSILNDRGIQIKDDEQTIGLVYIKSDITALSELFECISLLKYLESNYAIFKHTNTNRDGFQGNFVSKNITQEIINERAAEFVIQPIPTNIYEIIRDYKRSFIITGSELRELVSNNFRSIEQIHHEKEISVARLSFYIALIALIFSLISPFLFDTTINKDQIDEIKLEIRNRPNQKKNNQNIIPNLDTRPKVNSK